MTSPSGPHAPVAVLHGDGGTVWPGADLHAVGTPSGNRGDRAPLLEQVGLDERAAMANEFRSAARSSAVDALPGSPRFAAGDGRHGRGVG